MKPTKPNVLLVVTNVPDAGTANRIARLLVERRLAACVNIVAAVRSVYRWQGAIEDAGEVQLHAKTTTDRYAELEAAIRSEHPYEVPEIIAIAINDGLPAYLDWVVAETQRDADV